MTTELNESVVKRFKPYPEYKDSGNEWLGKYPKPWKLKPLKYVASYNDEVLPESTAPDFVIQYVDISSVGLTSGIQKTEEYEFEKAPSRARRKVRAGDTIVSTVRTYLKAIAPIKSPPENLIVSTGFAVIRPGLGILERYLTYQLQNEGFIQAVVANSVGVSYPGINASLLVSLPALLPSPDEQQAIANFLDKETARIDELIAKKQRLIELLQEKRTALISQAVTKGLNPHAPMKDSGIEWLGEIPAHWKVAQLRRFINFITSGSRGWAEHYADSGSIFVRIGNLTRDSIGISLEGVQYVDPPLGAEGERTRIKSGDILFSITAYLGSVAVASASLVNAYINQHIALVRVGKDKIVPEFCAFLALSQVGQGQLNGQAYGGTKIQLALDDVKSLWLTVPPLAEQVIIANYLNAKMEKFDQMASKVEEAIERLQEYRTALISAAVTGKIDVRQLATEEPVTA